jgi:hypothetical protein
MPNWENRWGSWISPKPVMPGVWKCRGGGHLVRGRVKDPRTGKMVEFKRVLPTIDKLEAYRLLQEAKEQLRRGAPAAPATKMLFADFATSLFEEKVLRGRISSAKSREKWEHVLRLHILPTFGHLPVSEPFPPGMVDMWL